jgi:predicted metal-dependent hydrolase
MPVASVRPSAPVPVRRVTFEYPDDLAVLWNPDHPEFAAAANAVSLLMPYAEPYFVRSVRDVLGDLDPALAERASAYARQEGQHLRQHRRFNDLLVAQVPRLARAERAMARTYGGLGRRCSARFNLAFAAASETIAFALARWAMRHHRSFFGGADPTASTLFLWHLAEEVEHKSVAFDVWEAVDGKRLRYAWAMLVTVSILATFVFWTMAAMLASQRRFRRLRTWPRLARLWLSFTFQVLPDMAASAFPRHHPTDFTDPPWLTTWLRTYDPASRTMPLWTGDLPGAR